MGKILKPEVSVLPFLTLECPVLVFAQYFDISIDNSAAVNISETVKLIQDAEREEKHYDLMDEGDDHII